MKASIDQLVDKLERQVKRYREQADRRRTTGGRARRSRCRTMPVPVEERAADREDEAVPGEADERRRRPCSSSSWSATTSSSSGTPSRARSTSSTGGATALRPDRADRSRGARPAVLAPRRRRAAHERLAREAGIDLDSIGEPVAAGAGADDEPLEPHERIPFSTLSERSGSMGSTASGGGTRSRASRRPTFPATRSRSSTLPDGTVLVEEDVPDGALTPLAEAIEQELEPPYRATAIRREDGDLGRRREQDRGRWSSGGDRRRHGQLAVQGGERTLMVDERPGCGRRSDPRSASPGSATRSSFVRAERLDGDLWVKVNAL